ncbi:MAG TPA: hypothetical protein VJT49_14005 [Amycolatopsis sp.]|uniref:hypothetical protein n=1 Tax=Amycolatopsis sp. TaxID=37632 RepID=UPI002B45DA4A|nr:hypothetical protein [Amycolatopsis sp.]HKS46196.1 hypothetical protein [Amycolatopsis sp.]
MKQRKIEIGLLDPVTVPPKMAGQIGQAEIGKEQSFGIGWKDNQNVCESTVLLGM